MRSRVSLFVCIALAVASIALAGPNRWSSGGPSGGRMDSMAVDPRHPAILYAAMASAGLYRSSDRGANWYRVDATEAYSVAVDASSNVFVVGSGHVRMSSDGGETWIVTSLVDGGDLAADPRAEVLYLWNPLRRSTDGGASWTGITSGLPTANIRALAIDPVDTSNLYVIAMNAQSGADAVYRSSDGGLTWAALTAPDPNFTSVSVNPLQPDTIYVGALNAIEKSTDGGATWSVANAALTGGYVYAVACDPRDASVLYAAGGGSSGYRESDTPLLFKSTNGGQTWTPAMNGVPTVRALGVFVDRTDSSIVYAALDGAGVLKSTDAGATWADSSEGLAARQILSVTADPQDGRIAYASDGTTVMKTLDAGRSWNPLGVRATAVAVDPHDSHVLYAVGNEIVSKSTDAGATWSVVSAGVPTFGVIEFLVDPASAGVFYLNAGQGGVLKSVNAGITWVPGSGIPAGVRIRDLALDPADASVLYLASDDGFYRSLNSGVSWAKIDVVSGGANTAQSVAIDSRGFVYAAFSDRGVYRSADGGATWTRLAPDMLPGAYHLVVDPSNPDALYTDMLRSGDGGATWTHYDAGLDVPFLTAFAIDRSGRYLYAAGYQSSVFAFHPTLITLPVAASLQGIGAYFRSDVVVLNTSPFDPLTVTATYRCYGGACGNAVQSFTLQPQEARRFADIVVSLFGAPGTGGPIEFSAPSHFVVTSRLYTPGDHGTYGQFIPGLSDEDSYAGVATPSLSFSTSSFGGFRTNTGVYNASDTAQDVSLSAFDDSGALAGEVTRHLGPHEATQVNNVFGTAGVTRDLEHAYCVIRGSANAPLFGWSSVVDNQSLDPTFVRGSDDDNGLTGTIVLPAAASLHGINAFFHSDVAVLNVSHTAPADVTARYHALGGVANVTRTFTVAPRQSLTFDDAVGTFFGAGETGGAIEFATTGHLAVTSRLYTPSKPAPTYGQFVYGMPMAMGFSRAVVTGLSFQNGFRSNVGVYNASDVAQNVTFDVRAADGTPLGSVTRTVPARQPLQINDIFTAVGVVDAVPNGYCIVSGSVNAPLFAYASVLDNQSNDPVFVYGEWME